MGWTGQTRRLMWTGQKYLPGRVQLTSLLHTNSTTRQRQRVPILHCRLETIPNRFNVPHAVGRPPLLLLPRTERTTVRVTTYSRRRFPIPSRTRAPRTHVQAASERPSAFAEERPSSRRCRGRSAPSTAPPPPPPRVKSTERTKCPFYDRFHLAAEATATVETAPIFLSLRAEAHKQARAVYPWPGPLPLHRHHTELPSVSIFYPSIKVT